MRTICAERTTRSSPIADSRLRRPEGRKPQGATAAILTAGCRLNQSESDALRGRLAGLGFSIVRNTGAADHCYVNTCTVTAAADRSSVQLIRRACRTVPKPKVVVLGCLAQRAPESVRSIPGVDEVWDNPRKQAEISGACPEPARSRAFLKVQDGCDRECGYCVVARLRGRPASVSAPVVCDRFERLLGHGFSEVVLTGLNLGLYRDEDGADLAGLVRMLLARSDGRPVRIRLGSLEPDTVGEEVLGVVNDTRVAPHFHLALQSGDDRVLAAMGRRYDGRGFVELVAAIRRARPDANIGLDVIAGLPGEDEESFERTRAFVRDLAPGYLHAFSYSPRPGTPAARMDGAAPGPERKRRVRVLRELSVRSRQDYQRRFVGTVRSAVVETCAFALTDNYMRLALAEGRASAPRSMVEVLVSLEQGRLVGRQAKERLMGTGPGAFASKEVA